MGSTVRSHARLRADAFEWRSWSGEAVIYDARSGETHRVFAPGGWILELVAAGEVGIDPETLSARLPQEATPEELAAVPPTLDALIQLGILEKVDLEDQ